MSATRTVASKTKTTSGADQDRLDRHARRNASRVIALAKEAARKKAKRARSDLALTQKFSTFTEDVTKGARTRTEARTGASELRDKMQDIRDLLDNLHACLGGVA